MKLYLKESHTLIEGVTGDKTLPPGEYEVEKIGNPIADKLQPCLAIKGTNIWAAINYLREQRLLVE